MSLDPPKRLRLSSPTVSPPDKSLLATSLRPTSTSPPPPPPPPSRIDALPRALQSCVLAFLDQAGFAAAAQISRAWLVVATLPTSVPAALRLEQPRDGIPTGFLGVLYRAATAPRAALGRLRSLALTRLAMLDATKTAGLAAAIRALPSLVALEVSGTQVSLDNLVHALVARPGLPGVRTLAIGVQLRTTRFVAVARAFPALTHLTISPDCLSRKIAYWSPDEFAKLGSRRHWQNWRALSLFAHLERLTLSSRNAQWEIERDDDADDDASVVAREDELVCGSDPAAAAAADLRDRSSDRRPRRAPTFSGVTELELVGSNGASARPIFDLVRHLPRLARLTLRQCSFHSPLYPAPQRRDCVENLAELRIERTRDCDISGGVDFALRHTDVPEVQVYGLRPRSPPTGGDKSVSTACIECADEPAAATAVCTAVTGAYLNGNENDAEAVADNAALVAASRRPLVVHYHYHPDACRCNFVAPPNVSFVRHPMKRTS